MRLLPFRKKREEHKREDSDIRDVRRRQKKVELELRTMEVLTTRKRGR